MEPFTKLLGFDIKNMKIKTELIAGAITFLTTGYILAVNPAIFPSTGMNKGALFTAAALSAATATLLLAFMAKLPFAQTPSTGLSASFAYMLRQAMGHSWERALAIMLIEGPVFLLITFSNVHELILDSIPKNLWYAISAGIGTFIVSIGLESAGIIIAKEGTFMGSGVFIPESTLNIIAILLSGTLMARNVKGPLFYGIVVATPVGIPTGATMISGGWLPVSAPQDISPAFCHFDFNGFPNIKTLLVFFSLLIANILDTVGILIGLAKKTGIVRPDSSIPRAKEAMMNDAIGTTCGAMFRSSTITTYTESVSGIAEDGRSGVTSAFVDILFLLSLLVSPIFPLIPGAATSGALVSVGVLMLDSVKKLDLSDVSESFPAFITMITAVPCYSIADGTCLDILSHMILKPCVGRWKQFNITLVTLAILLIINFVFN